jgi:hypothetical protein
MPDRRLLELARDARERAEEILAKAETFKDASAKKSMLEIAANYKKLAAQLETASADEP